MWGPWLTLPIDLITFGISVLFMVLTLPYVLQMIRLIILLVWAI